MEKSIDTNQLKGRSRPAIPVGELARRRILLITCSDCGIDLRLVHDAPALVNLHSVPAARVPRRSSIATKQSVLFDQLLAAYRATDIIVCGHSQCWTLKRSLEDASARSASGTREDPTRFGAQSEIMGRIQNNSRQAALLIEAVKQETLAQFDHLRSYEIVAEGERDGRLALHAWLYLDDSGLFLTYRPSDSQFIPL